LLEYFAGLIGATLYCCGEPGSSGCTQQGCSALGPLGVPDVLPPVLLFLQSHAGKLPLGPTEVLPDGSHSGEG
jgi:hypothetical protein